MTKRAKKNYIFRQITTLSARPPSWISPPTRYLQFYKSIHFAGRLYLPIRILDVLVMQKLSLDIRFGWVCSFSLIQCWLSLCQQTL